MVSLEILISILVSSWLVSNIFVVLNSVFLHFIICFKVFVVCSLLVNSIGWMMVLGWKFK